MATFQTLEGCACGPVTGLDWTTASSSDWLASLPTGHLRLQKISAVNLKCCRTVNVPHSTLQSNHGRTS